MNYIEKALKALRRQRRQKQGVVIVVLVESEITVAFANAQKIIWQEECGLGVPYSVMTREQYWQEVEKSLRSLLLAHDVEENLPCVLLPAETMLYEEKLVLPLLSRQELQETVSWETQQCVPWPADSYVYTYWEEERTEQLHVRLVALPLAVWDGLHQLAGNVLLQMGDVSAQGTLEMLQQSWYEGQRTPWYSHAKKSLTKHLLAPSMQRLYRAAALALLLMSMLLCGVAFAGRYLAQQELEDVHRELQQEQLWQQHFAESRSLRQQIAKLRTLQKNIAGQQLLWSEELHSLSRQLVGGCWMTEVEQREKDMLQLVGKARNSAAVQDYVQRLQQCGRYKDVRLLETSSADKADCTYTMQVVLQQKAAQEQVGKRANVGSSMQEAKEQKR